MTHVIAPGQRKKLSNFLVEENHDINAFPDLFPDGKAGLHDKSRKRKISPVQNYNQKCLNHDRRFAEDADFLFVAQQSLEKHSFENQISISTQRGVSKSGNGNVLKSNSFIDVFKTVVGTPMYFKKFRNETLARMEQLGPFHFFVTLSAAEMNWPEITTAILHIQGKKIIYEDGWEEDEDKIKIQTIDKNNEEVILTLSEYKKKEIRNKSDFFKNNFFLITRMFNARVKAFIKLMTANGNIQHYSYRIEFQLRGMPHLHGIFWLNKNEIKDCFDENGDYKDDDVVKLIDKWISCALNPGDDILNKLVKEVNIHGHTPSCKKGKSQLDCRFNFPKFPSRRTLIAHPPSTDLSEERLSELEEILKRVKKTLDTLDNMTDDDVEELYHNDLDNFLADLDISIDDYEEALSTSQRGKIVILKRNLNERNVNNYNKEFIMAWQANMDIQFCYDGYAVVTYITDYFSKTDAGITKALQEAVHEKKDCNDLERLNYIKRIYFTHKQAGLAEATYRLTPGMYLIESNVKTIFVATGYPKNRSNFYRKVPDEENEMDFETDSEDEDEDYGAQEELFQDQNQKQGRKRKTINIPGRQGKFAKVDSIHQKYANRPDELEKMCLAQFATSYSYCKKPTDNIIFNKGITDEKGDMAIFGSAKKLPKYIQLRYGGYMKLRGYPFVLRIHSSRNKKDESESLYSELQLFFPWRSEEKLKTDCNKAFTSNYEIIKSNKTQIFPNSPMIDEMRELLERSNDTRPQHMFENIDVAGQQENLDDEEMMEPLDDSVLPYLEDSPPQNSRSDGVFRPIIVEEDEVMLEMARNLSFEQRIVFDQMVKFCKSILRLMMGATNVIQLPPCLIVTGNLLN